MARRPSSLDHEDFPTIYIENTIVTKKSQVARARRVAGSLNEVTLPRALANHSILLTLEYRYVVVAARGRETRRECRARGYSSAHPHANTQNQCNFKLNLPVY